ncbi:MAG: alpha/beta hydrolase [Kofleriaceae bacterium]
MRLACVVAVAACSSTPAHAPAPARTSPLGAVARWQIRSEEIVLTVGGREVPGTITAPLGEGPFPAVLVLAGSGPTDRDWNSPLLPTKNGSARLLADRLAHHGAVVLRFDKAGSGKNPGPPPAQWTLDSYREEGLAALAALRARKDVRRDRIFVAGHSEGGIHATRLIAAAPDVAGVLYLASAVRSMADTLLNQLDQQLHNPLAGLAEDQIQRELASIRGALAAFFAGKAVDPTTASTIPAIQHLFAGLVAPATANLLRTLLAFDNSVEAPKLAVPSLVVNGGKDIQIDPALDAARLAQALRSANRDVTLVIVPDADHVLKHETRTVAELRADLGSVQQRYNADDRTLDDALVKAIVDWLVVHAR